MRRIRRRIRSNRTLRRERKKGLGKTMTVLQAQEQDKDDDDESHVGNSGSDESWDEDAC